MISIIIMITILKQYVKQIKTNKGEINMSVNYYSCDSCGDARYEEYIAECDGCGRSLCDKCISNLEDEDWFDIINKNDGCVPKERCPFCNGSEIDNEELLAYIINKYELDLEKEKELFKENSKIQNATSP